MSLLTLSLLTLSLLTLSLLTRTAARLTTGRLRVTTARRATLLATGFSIGSRTWRRLLRHVMVFRVTLRSVLRSLLLRVSSPFPVRPVRIFSVVGSGLRRTCRLLAGTAIVCSTFGLRPTRLHRVRRALSFLPTMIENSLHRLAVIGAVGSHRRSRLLLTTSLLSATTLTVGLPALRIFSRTTFSCGAFPRLIATRLLCRARLASLLATRFLPTFSLAARSLRPIGLFAVGLLPAAALPLPATALSSSARATGFASLPLRRSLLLVVAGLRLLATLLTAAGGTALLPGLGLPLLATVLLRGVLLRRFLLRLVLLSLARLFRLLAAPVAGALFAGCLGLTARRIFARRIFALPVLLLLPISTLRHASTVCCVLR